jgi:hypothetical protein
MRMRWPDDSTTPTRDELARKPGGTLYLESWFLMRLVVGLLGVLMPFLLIAGDAILFPRGPLPGGSLSSYYHSGMRDVFVGILCVVGVFLIAYMALHWNWDNAITMGAGAAAIVVALVPTNVGAGGIQTPVQQKFGQDDVAHVHFIAAGVFVVLLAVMSLRFGRREDEVGRNRRWRSWHFACGLVILAALVLLAVAEWAGVHSVAGLSVLLFVEVVSTLAFGLSWLIKGGELSQTLVRRGLYGEAAKTQRLAASPASGPPSPGSPASGPPAASAM